MNIEFHTIGELLIVFALAANVLYGFGFFMLAKGQKSYEYLAFRSYYLFAGLITLACILLYYLFFSHNYLFSYVYDYNELTQPFEYIVAGFWGGQEGTYLLWVFMNAVFGFILLKKAGQYRNWAMVVFSGINLFFLVIMVKLSPFALLGFWAADGLGLNPLLRDFWMVIHPPIIFIGYSMVSLPFCIAIAALIKGDFSEWVRCSFPWVVISSVCLAAGNILGGYWAYKTLGWGGYWAWDPVENSSFIPWMASLALLHGLILEKRTGALRRINLLLTSFVFLLVVYGTYLTRSGVLSDFSVHSFADMGINIYLVIFMIVSLVFTLIVFGMRMGKVEPKPLNYNYYSKEFIIFSGVVLLFIMSIVVLFWTSLPLMTTVLTDAPRAAEKETYNQFALPLAIVMSLFLTMTPLGRWAGFKLENWQKKFTIVGLAAVVLSFGLFYLILDASLVFAGVFAIVVTGMTMFMYNPEVIKTTIPGLIAFVTVTIITVVVGVDNYLYVLFFATASMAAVTNFTNMVLLIPSQIQVAGAQLTHFGLGILLVGILASSGFVTTNKAIIAQGAEAEVYGTKVSYWGMENDIYTPNNKLLLSLDHDGDVTDVTAELYYSERMNGIMRKPYIDRSLMRDLYLAPSTIDEAKKPEAIMKKGDTKHFENFALTFTGFEMGSHGEENAGGMKIIAHLNIDGPSGPIAISPVFDYSDKNGEMIMVGQKESFTVEGHDYDVTIKQIYADQGAVELVFGGAGIEAGTDKLVLDVTVLPLVNLVWIGTTLILLGTLIAFIRRKKELVISDLKKSD